MQDIQEIVSVAQENVACDDELYGGSVGFVDTKPFYMDVLESPDDAGFHYHNNALSFLNIGKSVGDEMILAMNDMAFCTPTLVDELTTEKQLMKITDLLGRETENKPNKLLIHFFDDGSIEKKIMIE
ncbi:MAG: hypothetical protein HKN32_08965 [Flavobacteriales bacterium]|nr:hypothetical protein [Flavobacteriales bacterium]